MDWLLEISTDRENDEPLFLAIARSISHAIRTGRVRSGEALPGSRTLAASLGVHRNTVLAALRELASEGWIDASPARGTFVRPVLPDPAPRRLRGEKEGARSPERLAFELRGQRPTEEGLESHFTRKSPSAERGVLPLLGGIPDLRLLPTLPIARAYRRALTARGRPSLGYGDPHGDERLRAALGSMLGRVRGIASAAEGLVVTRGSQMALHLTARAILAPGDVVLVEELGYRPAWEAFKLAGARLLPVPVDGEGLRTDVVAALCARENVRALYTTPHHQYPTTIVLSPGRRMTLLGLARRHGFAVIEDDYDHEFHYDGRPTLPLASTDAAGSVVYVGTLSKILAPGLRLGFVVAPEPVARRIAELRVFTDRQGDLVMERAIADLLEDGEIQRHARRMKRIYHERRDALVDALGRHLGDVLEFRVPPGGLAIWANVDRRVDTEAWATRAGEAKVLVHTMRRFQFAPSSKPRRASGLRLGFAPLSEQEIQVAVKRLAAALP